MEASCGDPYLNDGFELADSESFKIHSSAKSRPMPMNCYSKGRTSSPDALGGRISKDF